MSENQIDLSKLLDQCDALRLLRQMTDWNIDKLRVCSKAKNFEQRKEIADSLETFLHNFEKSLGLREEKKKHDVPISFADLIAQSL